MQLPSVDRNPNVRPAGADLASSAANKVIPVAPVNPSVSVTTAAEPSPSVINLVNQAAKPNQGEPVYTSVADPTAKGNEEATLHRDWTIHRPVPQKVENPPPKPISQVLMDHLRTMWTASASAVQVEQVKNINATPPQTSIEGAAAHIKQQLVYSASKVNKNENI
ncbi:hypothetical protein [Rhodoferax aquaticus]|uniref:Uncharacterized protein n=1 Tax=Rhodoferax aquaticus TaxID=2527691 RepID=A0A515ESU4_9BURK|nr:hypothetical protein [Rhodoferax aquaticus]QDL55734.1 hypothetical protein EXZ61_17015 [Rhodoferax aquaticus]